MIQTMVQSVLKRLILRRTARSALLKDSEAYNRLYRQLQAALSQSWDEQMRKGIVDALDRLRDLGDGKFTKADGKAIMAALERYVGTEAIAAAMRDPLINLGDGLFRAGATEIGAATGINIAFNRADLDALDILKAGNLFWIGESWNLYTQDKIASILEDYFNQGMTRQELTARFARDFANLSEKGRVYWELLADHTATKTREMGRVTGYERAGIDRVQVRANLDDRTTSICRQMHGRVIPLTRMKAQRDTWLDAASKRDAEGMKSAWAMHGAETDFSSVASAKLPANTAGPPYHFRCRTITVAYFASSEVNDPASWRQKIIDRGSFDKAEIDRIKKHAANASWMSEKPARSHFTKHRANIATRKLKDYEADARALVTDKNARTLLSARVPNSRKGTGELTAHAIFAKPAKSRTDDEPGYLVTIVDLEENVILSHHWRDRLISGNDIVPAVEQRKGIWKWLFG